ncbi:hypothetical protein [Escherichia coli]|uniref:hypothetical protein n=1 Tax=Escherichia coli TaxID=562 RepID=UPI0007A02C0B|nr:hypothetical protein [Escherichia coli]KYR86952.1 hypothetical protein AML13_00045 [Escherichia coli]
MFKGLVVTLLACIVFGPWVLVIALPILLIMSLGNDIKKLQKLHAQYKENPGAFMVSLVIVAGLIGWVYFSLPTGNTTANVEEAAVVEEKANKGFRFIVGVDSPVYGPEAVDPAMVHAWLWNRTEKGSCNQLKASANIEEEGDTFFAWCKDIKGNDRWFTITNIVGVSRSLMNHPEAKNPLTGVRLKDGPIWIDLYGTQITEGVNSDIQDKLKDINNQYGAIVETSPMK